MRKSAESSHTISIEPNGPIAASAREPEPVRTPGEAPPSIRPPRAGDAARIWALVRETPALDPNSPYAYLLLCTDFAATGAVAESGGELLGFVLGYRPPARPEVCFVWQVGVRHDQRGRGLAAALLERAVAPALADGARFLEATVTPSNAASRALFDGFARRMRAPCSRAPAFPSHLFPGGSHEDEVRIRIGPLSPDRSLEP